MSDVNDIISDIDFDNIKNSDKYHDLLSKQQEINYTVNNMQKLIDRIKELKYSIQKIAQMKDIRSLSMEYTFNGNFVTSDVNDAWDEIKTIMLKSLKSKLIVAQQKYDDLYDKL